MKKSFLLIAATAIILVGCSETDTFNDDNNQDVAIGFSSPYFSKPTKAEITDAWKTTDGSAFGVYGYKAGSPVTNLFTNEQVTYGTSTSSWTHPTVRYWDKSTAAATAYSFYAYAPFISSGVTINNGLFTIPLGTQVFSDATVSATTDLCIAQAVEGIGYGNATYTNPAGTVTLTFNHVLSKLSFKVKKADDLTYDVKLNALTVGFPTGTGVSWAQATKPAAAAATGNVTYATYTPATAGSYTTTIVTGKSQTVEASPAAAIADAHSYIVTPIGSVTAGSTTLTKHDINVKVNYTIDYDTNASDDVHNYDAQEAYGVAEIAFAAGNHYFLTIIINPDKIEFDIKTLVGFTDVDTDELEVK